MQRGLVTDRFGLVQQLERLHSEAWHRKLLPKMAKLIRKAGQVWFQLNILRSARRYLRCHGPRLKLMRFCWYLKYL